MELKFFGSKFIYASKFAGLRSSTSSSMLFFSSCSSIGAGKSHQQFCFCGVISSAASESNTDKAISSVGPVHSHMSRINGINGTTSSSLFSEDISMLNAFDDEYGGVVVNSERLPSNPHVFASVLNSSLSRWKIKGKKGIWLKLPSDHSELVPVAIKEGFNYHHAEPGYVMLTYWIPEGPCMLPSNASHQVGVGGLVLNDKNEVLVVQEKYCSPPFLGSWKVPTGFVRESEEIFTGAVREVKEETGIDTEFVEVIALRHAQNMAFEKSDLFFICMLKPLSTDIKVDDLEIQAAKWMPLVEFAEQPVIREDSMFKRVIDIFVARLGKQYCGLYAHHVISKFDGRSSTLYYNILDDGDFNCQPC
ncbi:nudix (nucleoside diphosphate linked moiety X)-type motif 8 [Ancistrocladus abbreviatus]